MAVINYWLYLKCAEHLVENLHKVNTILECQDVYCFMAVINYWLYFKCAKLASIPFHFPHICNYCCSVVCFHKKNTLDNYGSL